MIEEKAKASVEYNGRKTSRTGSERRRKAILEAALRIVVREGIRGVRHRAVAKEAEVPLSATTYYFKDISDLIADTFVLFAENVMTNVMDPIEAKVVGYIRQCDPEMLSSPEGKGEVVRNLARTMATHIMEELRIKRDHLMAEQAFMLEALRDPRLRALALRYKEKMQSGLAQVCELLGSEHADDDAWILVNAIIQMEHENLLLDIAEIDILSIESRLSRLFTALLA